MKLLACPYVQGALSLIVNLHHLFPALYRPQRGDVMCYIVNEHAFVGRRDGSNVACGYLGQLHTPLASNISYTLIDSAVRLPRTPQFEQLQRGTLHIITVITSRLHPTPLSLPHHFPSPFLLH